MVLSLAATATWHTKCGSWIKFQGTIGWRMQHSTILKKAKNFMHRYPFPGLHIRALLYLGLAVTLAHSATVRANEAAHVHGQGHVNIAFENDRIYMELESPGADIVGFEYAARSTAETEAVAKALAMLQDALQMLRFDAGAGCSVVGASADIETEDAHDGHDGHDGHDHNEHEAGGTSPDQPQAGMAHAAYIAEYEIRCANIDALKSIEFTYFEHFRNAQSLNIVLIQGAQQRQLQIDRSNPVLTL